MQSDIINYKIIDLAILFAIKYLFLGLQLNKILNKENFFWGVACTSKYDTKFSFVLE